MPLVNKECKNGHSALMCSENDKICMMCKEPLKEAVN